MLGDTEATDELASLLASRIFPIPGDELHLLENFMHDSREDLWANEGSLVKEGTLHAAMQQRTAVSNQVRPCQTITHALHPHSAINNSSRIMRMS